MLTRLGPSYWKIPQPIRRRLCFESQIAKQKGIKSFYFGQNEKVNARLFNLITDSRVDRIPCVRRRYELSRPAVHQLREAVLVGDYATPITDQGRVLMTPFRYQPRMMVLEPQVDLLKWIEGRREHFLEIKLPEAWIVPMVNRLEENYFHWITEYCGWIKILTEYQSVSKASPFFLLRENGPAFQRESLRLLGLPDEKLIYWPEKSEVLKSSTACDLIVPSLPGDRFNLSPQNLCWLRSQFRNRAQITQSYRRNGKIYISRKIGAWRSVVNENECQRLLKQLDFLILDPATLSFSEQVDIFSHASLIVGMHGAGLTNCIFSESAGVVELTGSYGGNEYAFMAAALGHNYVQLQCEPKGDDVVVDTHVLKNLIEKFEFYSKPENQKYSHRKPNASF